MGGVVTAVLTVAVVLVNIRNLVEQLYPGWNGDWSSLQGMTPNTSNIDPSTVFPFIAEILVVLVILWIISIITAFFIWRSLKQFTNRSGHGAFGTSGLILLIGAFIPFLGVSLMWIATLILSTAFFTLRPQEPFPETAIPPSPPPTIT